MYQLKSKLTKAERDDLQEALDDLKQHSDAVISRMQALVDLSDEILKLSKEIAAIESKGTSISRDEVTRLREQKEFLQVRLARQSESQAEVAKVWGELRWAIIRNAPELAEVRRRGLDDLRASVSAAMRPFYHQEHWLQSHVANVPAVDRLAYLVGHPTNAATLPLESSTAKISETAQSLQKDIESALTGIVWTFEGVRETATEPENSERSRLFSEVHTRTLAATR